MSDEIDSTRRDDLQTGARTAVREVLRDPLKDVVKEAVREAIEETNADARMSADADTPSADADATADESTTEDDSGRGGLGLLFLLAAVGTAVYVARRFELGPFASEASPEDDSDFGVDIDMEETDSEGNEAALDAEDDEAE